ncbi:hypothetical protein ES703_94049 [subsurface metagenome]
MQYEIILIALMGFGGLMLSVTVYLNRNRLKKNEVNLELLKDWATKLENELAEWSKEIEKE